MTKALKGKGKQSLKGRSKAVQKGKMSKKEFLRKVAKDNDMTVSGLTAAYDAIIDGIKDVVSNGQSLSLTGFGVFYLHKHKGHPVQFEGREDVPDYVVFKFSASDVLNRKFRADHADGLITVGKR